VYIFVPNCIVYNFITSRCAENHTPYKNISGVWWCATALALCKTQSLPQSQTSRAKSLHVHVNKIQDTVSSLTLTESQRMMVNFKPSRSVPHDFKNWGTQGAREWNTMIGIAVGLLLNLIVVGIMSTSISIYYVESST